MTTFLLIRHATHRLVGHTICGRMAGVSLSEEGRAQAERLAERLSVMPIDAIYCSPMERARETAEPLALKLGLPPQTSEGLNEFDVGEWAGRTFESLASDALWQRFNTHRSVTCPPGGELMLTLQARVVAEIERLRERHGDGMVALVSHADTIRAALLYYLGMPLDHFLRIEISPASMTTLALEEGGPRLLKMNET
jgi:probable phosphomutase (TIGR03848 family)